MLGEAKPLLFGPTPYKNQIVNVTFAKNYIIFLLMFSIYIITLKIPHVQVRKAGREACPHRSPHLLQV